MHSAEIELKFPVSSLASLERRLAELGFQLDTPRTFESNTLYDTPDRSLRQKGELLRVREYGGRHVVTHKRHPDDEESGSPYKVRIETESDVSDGDAMAEIFTRLGCEPAFRYEKYRSEYSHPGQQRHGSPTGHVVIDETPIGVYAEIEGPTGWIDQTLVALGVSPGVCLTESYGRLFTAWKKKTGSSAENLTFDEIRAAESQLQDQLLAVHS
jgi:adenylate cyclase class 2